MESNIYLSLFGTFGNPHGFTQSILLPKDYQGIEKFDLNPNAIKLFSSTDALYAIRKEKVGKDLVISYIKYSYASENTSNRGGTFVGVALVCVNGIEADVSKTVKCLDELHRNLINSPKNLNKDRVIMVKHSREYGVKFPQKYADMSAVSEKIEDIDFAKKGKNIVVYTSLENKQDLFQRGLVLLNSYDTIYFTNEEKVAQYVKKQNVYEITQESTENKYFSDKVKKVIEEKKKLQEKEAKKVLDEINDKIKTLDKWIENYEELKDKNEKIKKRNEEIEKRNKEINEKKIKVYKVYFQELKEIKRKLGGENSLKQKEIEKLKQERNRIIQKYEAEDREIPRLQNMKSIMHIGSGSDHGGDYNEYDERTSYSSQSTKQEEAYRGGIDWVKMIVCFIGFLLILLLLSLKFSKNIKRIFREKEPEGMVINLSDTPQMSGDTKNEEENRKDENNTLSPEPNGYLAEEERKKTV